MAGGQQVSEWEEFAAYAPMIRKAKAEAWEEGYAAGSADSYDGRLDADNPYMKENR